MVGRRTIEKCGWLRARMLFPEEQRFWNRLAKILNHATGQDADADVARTMAHRILSENRYGYILPSIIRRFPEVRSYYKGGTNILKGDDQKRWQAMWKQHLKSMPKP